MLSHDKSLKIVEAVRAIDTLERLRAAIEGLLSPLTSASEQRFIDWKRDTETALLEIFGEGNKHLSDFSKIRYTSIYLGVLSPNYPFYREWQQTPDEKQRAMTEGLNKAKSSLSSAIADIPKPTPLQRIYSNSILKALIGALAVFSAVEGAIQLFSRLRI